jgi:hypothetical protein
MATNRKMRILTLLCVLATFSLQSIATELRGRVEGIHPYASYPFPFGGARVDLYASSPQGPLLVGYAYTGGDGIYYFSGIYPGAYSLQVNGLLNFPLVVYPRPFQDIPPILLR